MERNRHMCIFLLLVGLMLGVFPSLSEFGGISNAGLLRSSDSSSAPRSEEYEVWSFVLTTEYSAKTTKELVIRARSATLQSDIKHLPSFDDNAEALQDFKEKNQTEYALDDKFHLALSHTLLSESAEEALFLFRPDTRVDTEVATKMQEGWRQFHRDHPGAQYLLSLSRVGLNPDRTVAIVFVGSQSSLMSARGTCFLLQKKGGSWAIERQQLMWFT